MIREGLAVVGALCMLGLAACPQAGTPCTPTDAVMAAHAVECRMRVKACGGDQACRSAVVADCDAWGEARCALDGAAGAP